MSSASYAIHKLWKRDKGVCWLCKKLVDADKATRDHVIPKSLGGPNEAPNLRTSHRHCNEARGNKVLTSKKEALQILIDCQDDKCFNCRNELKFDDARLSRGLPTTDAIRTIMIAVCKAACKAPVRLPYQKRRQIKAVRNQKYNRRMMIPMEMTVADTLQPYQVEVNDYVRFFSDGALHFGVVLDIEDNGDTFVITLSDDVEGETVQYEVDIKTDVSLLVHEAVAV